MDAQKVEADLLVAEEKVGHLLKVAVVFAMKAIGRGISAACQYLVKNGRMILGLLAFLLAAWGIDLQTVPAWAFAGKIMASTGITLKAWLSDSASKKQEVANAAA